MKAKPTTNAVVKELRRKLRVQSEELKSKDYEINQIERRLRGKDEVLAIIREDFNKATAKLNDALDRIDFLEAWKHEHEYSSKASSTALISEVMRLKRILRIAQ